MKKSLLLIPALLIAGIPVPTLANDVECLAKNLYHEARGEGERGMIAVAYVTMNRVEDKRFPDDVCSVVKYKINNTCAFSWVCEGRDAPKFKDEREKVLWQRIVKFSKNFITKWRVAKNYDITDGATHYHADYVQPRWAKLYEKTETIGTHIFYYAERL